MITLQIHNCGRKKKFPHKPEINIDCDSVKEAIEKGIKLVRKYRMVAYINWQAEKGYRYCIDPETFEINKYKIEGGENVKRKPIIRKK